MNNQQKQHLLVVVYDSVTNSVFESQVFVPLVRMVTDGQVKQITLVTFEAALSIEKKLACFNHPAITFIICKRAPLLGIWSLSLAAVQLTLAVDFKIIDTVRARGPLAGLIAKKAVRWQRFFGARKALPLTLQARGLCAEEHRFSSEQQGLSFGKKMVAHWRQQLYGAIERRAYRKAKGVFVEAVSEALGDYLQEHYATPPRAIILAQHDLVEMLDQHTIAGYRLQVRALLKIPQDAYVYCYSGSCKPWQCAEETVQFFMAELEQNKQVFLLILSQDISQFQKILVKHRVPTEHVCLLAVQPAQLLRYLCAADAGMLLRKPDVVNWVSRPTKLLEYQAVGLRVVHNNTIGLLAKKHADCGIKN